jgi:hypothetical protein
MKIEKGVFEEYKGMGIFWRVERLGHTISKKYPPRDFLHINILLIPFLPIHITIQIHKKYWDTRYDTYHNRNVA